MSKFDVRAPYTPPSPRGARAHAKTTVSPEATAAAERMEKQGGSPRIQLTAAKVSSGQSNLTYKPHQGARERARRAAHQASGEMV